jgi:catechol 2,3-dioxygenase-like lactoylglutathione lyase family enzyme
MDKPHGMLGIRHVALFVQALDQAVDFYMRIMGMRVEWQPDENHIYLTNGGDVLALHRVDEAPQTQQRLDHIGFALTSLQSVYDWHDYLVSMGVSITETPKLHRDGSCGFYCLDSVGHLLELIYHPPIVGK